jgi:hypothetical protein
VQNLCCSVLYSVVARCTVLQRCPVSGCRTFWSSLAVAIWMVMSASV